MFHKVIYIVVSIVLAIQHTNANLVKIQPRKVDISPYNLYDDALVKLGELKQIVDSAVLTAEADLDAARTDSTSYSNQEESKAQVEIQDEDNKIIGYIQDMANLVEGDGKNPNHCLELYRPHLDDLLAKAIYNLESCIADVNLQIEEAMGSGLNDIYSARDKVAEVEAQLLQCGATGSIQCISPISRQIDTYKVELPETIATLVHKTSGLMDTLTNEVDGCTSSGISSFTTSGNNILKTLEECFNAL